MNKYYRLLDRILVDGKTQTGRKGTSRYLLNESLSLTPADLLDIFEGHNIARRKLRDELRLFMNGERSVEKYREAGISWWDYCGQMLVNSYPTYFEKLPPLIDRINREKRSSKTMCCSSDPPTQKPIKPRASASCNFKSTVASWCCQPTSAVPTPTSDFRPTYITCT